MTDLPPRSFSQLAKLGRIGSETERGFRFVRESGSVLIGIPLTQFTFPAAGWATTVVAVSGYGLECVEGFSLVQRQGSTTASLPIVRLSLLRAQDQIEDGQDQNDEEIKRNYRTERGELYDGAVIAGTFERLGLRISVAASSDMRETLWIRVFTSPLTRPVPMPSPPRGLWIYDFFVGAAFVMDAVATNTTVFYDDSNPWRSQGDRQRPDALSQPAIGEGIGSDAFTGLHPSTRRSVVCWVKLASATATLTGWIQLRNGYPGTGWETIASFGSSVLVDEAGVTRTVLYMPNNITANRPSELVVPSGCIRIIGESDTASVPGNIWLTFQSAN